jgi:cytochrome b561
MTQIAPATQPSSYDSISRYNHWFGAIVMIAMILLGLALANVEFVRSTRLTLMMLHKATGFLLLFWGAWRVWWRSRLGFPSPIPAQPAWQERFARAVHVTLLATLLIMPVSGIADALLGGRDIKLYGLAVIPPIAKIAAIEEFAGFVHTVTGYILAVLVMVHIAAALYHHCVIGDSTLVRMARGRRP